MVEKILIIFTLMIFLFAMLATARYYLPKKKFINLIVFLVFFFIQVSPLLVFSFNRPSDTGREGFKKSVYEKCMNERELKQFCTDVSLRETRKQYDDVAYGPFMLFAIFVVIPISGLSMKLSTILINLFGSIKCSKNVKSIRWQALKILLISVVLCSLLFLGGLIVWGNCLPQAHVNSTIKQLSLLIGVPFCLSVYAIMAGFGNAFTYSGKHVAQEALESYIDTDHR